MLELRPSCEHCNKALPPSSRRTHLPAVQVHHEMAERFTHLIHAKERLAIEV